MVAVETPGQKCGRINHRRRLPRSITVRTGGYPPGEGRSTVQRVNDRLINWASIIEPGTLAQAEATASLPFVYPHLALMPDAHLGKGATVGSVIPTLGAIIPAAVGVDIGCGMAAVRTQFHRDELRPDLARLRGRVHRSGV
jgi:tRNA-splicing ligase RtcB